MGHIREAFGNITIESRSESFYIHPNYGWRRNYPQVPVREVPVSAYFKYTIDGEPWQVTGQLIGATLAEPVDLAQAPDSARRIYDNGRFLVHPVSEGPEYEPDSEEVEAEGNFAKHWRDTPNPEFLNEDIDDLIAALEDLREHLKGAP